MKKSTLIGILILIPFTLFPQEKPAITPDDYGKWESFGTRLLSPNGNFMAYIVRRVNKENELRIRNLETDSLKVVKYGINPVFSNNSRWLAYQITLSEEEKWKTNKRQTKSMFKQKIPNY